jgi:pimeloyl-ACP methyl ester carboxylesterase
LNKIFVSIAALGFCASQTCMAAQAAPDARPQTADAAAAGLTLAALKERYSDAASRYAQVQGLSIRYKDEGKGPAIVLLHGSYGSLDGYDALAKELAANHRVVRFDMPGMGLSEGQPAAGDSPTVLGDQILLELLDQLKIKQAVLVGTSSGGVIAAYHASAHPERVSALILANTPSDPVVNANVPRSPELRAEFDRAEREGMRDMRYWQTYLAWLQGRPERLKPQSVKRYYDMNRRAEESRPAWRSTAKVPDVYRTFAGVTAPTLLVWGARDFVLPLHTMHDLEARLPAASVSTFVLEDVGHYPPIEVPQRFGRIVEGYLADVAERN